jgi:hypothetical protein
MQQKLSPRRTSYGQNILDIQGRNSYLVTHKKQVPAKLVNYEECPCNKGEKQKKIKGNEKCQL